MQRRDIKDSHLSTAFTINVLAGVLFFSILILSAPLISSFFRKDILQALIIIISFKFISTSLGLVHEALLTKNLLFRRLAFLEISETVSYGVMAIPMAFSRLGVWSLARGYVMGSFIKAILSRIYVKKRYTLILTY